MRLYVTVAMFDVVALLIAMTVATLARFGTPATWQTVIVAGAILPIYALLALTGGAFSIGIATNVQASVKRAIRALIFSMSALVLLAFVLQASGELSRILVALTALLASITLVLARIIFTRLAGRLSGSSPYEVLLLCDEVPMPQPATGLTLMVDADAVFGSGTSAPQRFHDLATLIGRADRVVVHCPPQRRALWVAALKGANVQGEIMSPELLAFNPLGLASHNGVPTMVVARGPLDYRNRLLKRCFDLALASAAIVVLALPMLAIALAIALTSKGPVLFVQTRIGRGNRLFEMYKFRSMRIEAADGGGLRSATRDDDRITPLGRWLRRLSLDELPQLFNVLGGEMSIVGPRPHALGSRAEDQLFWEVDDRYWFRHAAKPGLTGLAQVRGFRGATLVRDDLTKRLQSDLEYLDGWSLSRDVAILARTVGVLFHRNAF